MALACAGRGRRRTSQVAAVVRAAEGLPLLVEDLLATGDLGGIPPQIRGTVRARLARLDARHRARSVGAAACSADGSTGGCWTGPPEWTAGRSPRRCTVHAALQLVTADDAGFAFRHALTREVVARRAGRPDR